MTAQTQAAILSGLKATGGIIATIGGATAAASALQAIDPKIGMWIGVAGVVTHGASTALNELIQIFQTVPVDAVPSKPATEAPKP